MSGRDTFLYTVVCIPAFIHDKFVTHYTRIVREHFSKVSGTPLCISVEVHDNSPQWNVSTVDLRGLGKCKAAYTVESTGNLCVGMLHLLHRGPWKKENLKNLDCTYIA